MNSLQQVQERMIEGIRLENKAVLEADGTKTAHDITLHFTPEAARKLYEQLGPIVESGKGAEFSMKQGVMERDGVGGIHSVG